MGSRRSRVRHTFQSVGAVRWGRGGEGRVRSSNDSQASPAFRSALFPCLACMDGGMRALSDELALCLYWESIAFAVERRADSDRVAVGGRLSVCRALLGSSHFVLDS